MNHVSPWLPCIVSVLVLASACDTSPVTRAVPSEANEFPARSIAVGPEDTASVTVNSPARQPLGRDQPAFVAPTPPQVFVNTSYPTMTGTSKFVAAGSNLQSVLDAARPGDEIVLADGATFTGNFVLSKKRGDGWIVIRSQSVPAVPGTRITPATAAGRAKIVTPNSDPAISAAKGASRWRLVGFEITQAPGIAINYGLVVLGAGDERARTEHPSKIILDRMFVHGTSDDQLKRCIALNGDSLAVIDSWLGDCHGKGFDSQGVAGWNGAGPFLIENNHIEGAGQAVFFGGADPVIQGLSPADIVIRRNHLFKPLSWGNGKWTIKATFELKHAKRVLFEGNVLENHWADAQVGYAILLKSESEGPASAWTAVEDVVVQNNIIKNSRNGANLAARVSYGGPAPVTPASRILLRNNLFDAVGRDPFLGVDEGVVFQLLDDLQDVTIINNTSVFSGTYKTAVMVDGRAQSRLTLASNVFAQSEYGIFGSDAGIGNAALDRYAPGATVAGNVIPGQNSASYPSGNYFPSSSSSIDFTLPGAADYSLTAANVFYSGPLGRVGIDHSELAAAVADVAQ
jgi:hypothetical protein